MVTLKLMILKMERGGHKPSPRAGGAAAGSIQPKRVGRLKVTTVGDVLHIPTLLTDDNEELLLLLGHLMRKIRKS